MSHPPLLGDVGVVALVPDGWHEVWQPRHQTMLQLSKYFEVVWLEPQPHWRRAFKTKPQEAYAYGVDPPPSLAVQARRLWEVKAERLGSWNRLILRSRLRRARRSLLRRGCRRVVLYLWRPEFAPALDLVTHDASCYHIDDEYTFSSVEQPISGRERELLERVDLLLIHSPALLAKKGNINPNTVHAPNGVDFASYATPAEEPADLVPIPRPRVLYSGRLKRQLDWGVLVDLAQRRRDWQFVMVGPRAPRESTQAMIDSLAAEPNAHFLGGKHPSGLPAYVQHSDVCVMPYVLDGYTRFIYPLKLHEYLAAGKAIVSSPIESVAEFSDVVATAQTHDEWEAALAEALGHAQEPQEIAHRQEVARRYDWTVLAAGIARAVASTLGRDLPDA